MKFSGCGKPPLTNSGEVFMTSAANTRAESLVDVCRRAAVLPATVSVTWADLERQRPGTDVWRPRLTMPERKTAFLNHGADGDRVRPQRQARTTRRTPGSVVRFGLTPVCSCRNCTSAWARAAPRLDRLGSIKRSVPEANRSGAECHARNREC